MLRERLLHKGTEHSPAPALASGESSGVIPTPRLGEMMAHSYGAVLSPCASERYPAFLEDAALQRARIRDSGADFKFGVLSERCELRSWAESALAQQEGGKGEGARCYAWHLCPWPVLRAAGSSLGEGCSRCCLNKEYHNWGWKLGTVVRGKPQAPSKPFNL